MCLRLERGEGKVWTTGEDPLGVSHLVTLAQTRVDTDTRVSWHTMKYDSGFDIEEKVLISDLS